MHKAATTTNLKAKLKVCDPPSRESLGRKFPAMKTKICTFAIVALCLTLAAQESAAEKPHASTTGNNLATVSHRFVETNGIRMHIAEQGTGPVVVLCHGWPETWYSWRHQLPALAAAGFHAVAPDMRGYGQTDSPQSIEQYTLLHLVGDMVGLLDALGVESAVIVGHDWGAPVAWHSALLRPDRFRGVVGLSVPFRQRGTVQPTTVMPRTDKSQFYQLYFQEPGIAEAEFERDIRYSIRATLYSASGDGRTSAAGSGPDGAGMVPLNGGFLSGRTSPERLPSWLSETDVDFYARDFQRSGFRGPFNWYRNIDRNWQLLAPFAGARVVIPALYIAGDRDPVTAFPGMEKHIANLRAVVPQLRRSITLAGCGHWTQQERPVEVNRVLIEFLKGL